MICLLASVLTPSKHLLIPRLSPKENLRDLLSIAVEIITAQGFQPMLYDNASSAKRAVAMDIGVGKYPLLVTPPDTTGEKGFEEFVAEGETTREVGFRDLLAVEYNPAPAEMVLEFVERMEQIIAFQNQWPAKEELVSWVSQLVPQLRHAETGKYLDERM